MIIMLPQCIVFDLDDPLHLERDHVDSGFRAVGGGRKYRHLFEAGVRQTIF
jgi:hypothetical protein